VISPKEADLDLATAIQMLPLKWYGTAVQNLAREFGTWDQFLGCMRAAREDLPRLRQRWPTLAIRDYIESVKYGMPDASSPSEAVKLYPAMSRLVEVYDVGSTTAEALLTDDEVFEVASTMADSLEIKPDPSVGGIFAGKEICFTGSLETMTRREAHGAVERLGGRVAGSVSPTTEFIVAGTEPQKLKKAEKLGIKILFESDFLKTVGLLPRTAPTPRTQTRL
jgi:NAD-dependent DNA ligase